MKYIEAARWYLCMFLVLITLIACSHREDVEVHTKDSDGWPSMRLCVNDALQKIKSETVTNSLIYEVTQVCYSHLHSQGLLNDFKLRRLKFIQQTYDERVLLWMVVIITLSGVALSGIQLLASFKLASLGKNNFDQSAELSIEQSKLSLKSSVTGLFILIFSFAFFWVFVYEIFVIKEIDIDKGSQKNAVPNVVQMGPFVPKSESPSLSSPKTEK